MHSNTMDYTIILLIVGERLIALLCPRIVSERWPRPLFVLAYSSARTIALIRFDNAETTAHGPGAQHRHG